MPEAATTADELPRSSQDHTHQQARLASWLRTVTDASAEPTVDLLTGSSDNGMSSDTLLFDVTWPEGSTERLVARLAPTQAQVFPAYDLSAQFRLIRDVGEQTDIPVPRVRWNESNPKVLGTPFFVMDRVDGLVPPDMMPYVFGDNWLFDATPEQQRAVQDSTVGVLAKLHAMPVPEYLEFPDAGDTALRRHIAHTRAWYEFAAADVGRSPLIESGFEWLDTHFPAKEGDPVISWGDSRIGNVMFREFEPVAVLDWEMAGVGPRELDIAWMLHAHRGFQDYTDMAGLDGMPDFHRRADILATYEKLTGYAPRDIDFYQGYAAVQWAIVYLRVSYRLILTGQQPETTDTDSLIMNRDALTRILAGTYTW
jgi:aminoglycoside phosphotransferase (APT) family kinase protein